LALLIDTIFRSVHKYVDEKLGIAMPQVAPLKYKLLEKFEKNKY
jgi:hypothetical protein